MPPSPTRFDRLDALRGVAMVWMTVYHFAFDLNHFGHIRQDFHHDPVWTWQRTAIVSLFLLAAGAGQAIAVGQGQGWARFGRRWLQVAGCALLVSLGSWWMFPNSWIYFGVLHGMAAMLLLVRLALGAGWARRPLGWAASGVALIALWWWLTRQVLPSQPVAEALNGRALNWLGLVTRKPVTQDYVPLLPWLGVMCAGVAMGLATARAGSGAWLARPTGKLGRALAWLGRHSLLYYMVHQPVLIGLLMGWGALHVGG